MESVLEKLLIGAAGGLIAYWLAQTRFISQRWWDKQFDLYIEAIDILKQIEHSLAIYEWALNSKQTIDKSETVKKAYLNFEEGLSKLHGLQSKMMLIGLDEAHTKLLVLHAGLSAVNPSYLSSNPDEDIQEIIELIKQSKNMTGGCSAELAFLGKEKLRYRYHYIKNIMVFLRKKFKYDNPKNS